MSAVARVTSIISEERVEFVFANEDQGSGGPGFKSRCFLRQGTLLQFVSLRPGVRM